MKIKNFDSVSQLKEEIFLFNTLTTNLWRHDILRNKNCATELGGAVVTHRNRIWEIPNSNPGPNQPAWDFIIAMTTSPDNTHTHTHTHTHTRTRTHTHAHTGTCTKSVNMFGWGIFGAVWKGRGGDRELSAEVTRAPGWGSWYPHSRSVFLL